MVIVPILLIFLMPSFPFWNILKRKRSLYRTSFLQEYPRGKGYNACYHQGGEPGCDRWKNCHFCSGNGRSLSGPGILRPYIHLRHYFFSKRSHAYRALCNQLYGTVAHQVVTEDIFLSILPLSHAYECSLGMLYPFMEGLWYIWEFPPTLPVCFRPEGVRLYADCSPIMEKIYTRQVFAVTGTRSEGFVQDQVHSEILHRIAGNVSTILSVANSFWRGGSKSTRPRKILRDARFPYSIGYGLTETAP